MCLCALIAGKNENASGRGFKVFYPSSIEDNKFVGWLYCAADGGYVVDKWYEARSGRYPHLPNGKLDCWILGNTPWYEECHCTENIERFQYETGFHIFLRRKDAEQLARKDDSTAKVMEVKWEGQCALGYDGANGASTNPVVVAKRMKILSEISENKVGSIQK